MIEKKGDLFCLTTDQSMYLFRRMPSGHLEHLYYGGKISLTNEMSALYEKTEFPPGNTIVYSKKYPQLALENTSLECSTYGNGDVRTPIAKLLDEAGNQIGDFLYESCEIKEGKQSKSPIPGSYDEKDQVMELVITLKSSMAPVLLMLHYFVYETCDVITRRSSLINQGDTPVQIESIMSMQLDLWESGFDVSSFHGAWAREMNRQVTCVQNGTFSFSSQTGTSSNRSNPFFMVSKKNTTQEHGYCMGFNLIYSGNHKEVIEVNSYGKTRILTGINPDGFSWKLQGGESFETPEAVFTISMDGFLGVSHQLHEFVREHIVRGYWKKKPRPVLLNSWEAAYFDINESKMLKLAKSAKEAGIELLVMDDGWFGRRNDDTSSLGDWTVNQKKFPGGLRQLSEKICALGIDFGIWVEPEMVNENSQCFHSHPDWVLGGSRQNQSLGRNQMILDLGRKEVQDYLIESMKKVFDSGKISYVKWDMNRIFSDTSSTYLPTSQKGEVMHRYVLGLYHVLEVLTKSYPKILFEGCASGGNRFDLGMLCYMPQIWASDNTDANSRSMIQQGYSYGYPLSTISAHVSDCPNHQTLRRTPLASRFGIACFGVLGYECNLPELTKEEQEAIKEQVALYKNWREVLLFGDFYRLATPYADGMENGSQWMCVSKDKKRAVALLFQSQTQANAGALRFMGKGLMDDWIYHFYNLPGRENIMDFGNLVNTVSPIYIKKDSVVHKTVARFVKLDQETEDYQVSGSMICKAGICLKQSYGGTGFNDRVRVYPDYASRMYFMEAEGEVEYQK